MKQCSKCKMLKNKKQFYTDNHKKDKTSSQCKKCSDKRIRGTIINNTQTIKDLKTKPCIDCGLNYPDYVMNFDHLPQYIKDFNIGGNQSRSIKLILIEISKCELVCTNCHAIRTKSRIIKIRPYNLIQQTINNMKIQSKCKDCDKSYAYECMEFDHIPERGPKLFNLSKAKNYSKSLVLKEVQKCELICGNCHRIRTHNRQLIDICK